MATAIVDGDRPFEQDIDAMQEFFTELFSAG